MVGVMASKSRSTSGRPFTIAGFRLLRMSGSSGLNCSVIFIVVTSVRAAAVASGDGVCATAVIVLASMIATIAIQWRPSMRPLRRHWRRLEKRLVVDRLAVDKKPLDCGPARRSDGGDDCDLPRVP